MKQRSFSDAEYDGKRKRTRREVFLAEMHRAVPWSALEGLIEPHYPKAGGGRRPYPLSTMLRIHCLQQSAARRRRDQHAGRTASAARHERVSRSVVNPHPNRPSGRS